MSKLGLISDIHANREALDAVFAHGRDVERWICLGDVVGYGPDPAYCVEQLIERRIACVRGNHDDGLVRFPDVMAFNPIAFEALAWQRGRVSLAHSDWLAGLPTSMRVDDELTLVHGCPPDDFNRYLEGYVSEVALVMRAVTTRACAVGHTHEPFVAVGHRGKVWPGPKHEWECLSLSLHGRRVALSPDERLCMNPGSVGQPRDGNPMAAYAVLDLQAHMLEMRRIAYAYEDTCRKITQARLPAFLAERLTEGR